MRAVAPRSLLVLAAVLAALAGAREARAAACCVGATGATPGVLGKCERYGLGLAWGMEQTTGSFGPDGAFRPSSGYARNTHRFTPTVAVRPTRFFQVGAAVPLLVQRVAIDGEAETGGGVGDASFWARFDPFEDTFTSGAGAWLPVPVLSLAVTLPTGRSWEQVDPGNGAALTGTGYATLTPAVGLERTLRRGVLSATGSVVVPLPRPAADGEEAAAGPTLPGIGYRVGLQGGWFATRKVTLTASGGVLGSGRGRVDGALAGSGTVAPWLGVGVVAGLSRTLRLSAGAEGTLPVPGLGRNHEATVNAGAGLTWVLTPADRGFGGIARKRRGADSRPTP